MAALLLDENMPRSAGRALAGAGHDVAFAADLCPGADDLTVLRVARDHERMLVTFDADFGELIYLHGTASPAAVLYVRMHPIDGALVAAWLSSALQGLCAGHFLVCSRDGVRRRPLPLADHG